MGGRRITKDELGQMETLKEEGLTTRRIAKSLDRTPAAIEARTITVDTNIQCRQC